MRGKYSGLRLALYGISHFIVDMCCFYILYAGVIPYADSDPARYRGAAVICFALYNCVAFGLQIVFGRLADRKGRHRLMAVTGCILLAAAVLFLDCPSMYRPVICALMAAMGNALFHTGGGTDTLLSARGKMTPNGLFVAPGAVGVAVGRHIGRLYPLRVAAGGPSGNIAGGNVRTAIFAGGNVKTAIFPAAMTALAMCVIASLAGSHASDGTGNGVYRFSAPGKSAAPVISAAVAVVILRALVGSYMPVRAGGSILADMGDMLPIALAVCAALGKALGGVFGDIFGARRISVISLTASAVLLAAGIWLPMSAPLAVLLFNFTMPITLCVCASAMPGRYGEAFGLTTLGLLIGSLPDYLIKLSYVPRLCTALPLILASAAMMYFCCADRRAYDSEGAG